MNTSKTTMPKLALTLGESAEALRVSVRTVERLLQRGRLRAKSIGRRRVIPVSELERFLAETDDGVSDDGE